MAHNSGMDYAIMAGSDVQRLGKGSTAALDKVSKKVYTAAVDKVGIRMTK